MQYVPNFMLKRFLFLVFRNLISSSLLYYFQLIWSEKAVNIAKRAGATSRKRNLQAVAGSYKYTRNIERHDVYFSSFKSELYALDLGFSQR
jgi:hypothetical protein